MNKLRHKAIFDPQEPKYLSNCILIYSVGGVSNFMGEIVNFSMLIYLETQK